MRLGVGGNQSQGFLPRRWWLGTVLALSVLPAAAAASENVYVANSSDMSVSQYAIGVGGGLSPLSPATVLAGSSMCAPGPVDVALTPDARSAYVLDFCPDAVWQYNVNTVTGALSPKAPATVANGGGSLGISVTPDGKSAYVTNVGPGTVSQYNIDPSNGALSPKTPATVASGPCPWGVAVTPDGKSAYAVDVCVGSVSQYSIDPLSGSLSPKTPFTVPSGRGPRGIAVTPNGKSAYVTNEAVTNGSTTGVSQYNIDPVSGALSPKIPATVGTGAGPEGVAVTPNGKSAYVTNVGPDTVSQYNIDPSNGALSPKTPATVAAGSGPWGVAVTPDGKSAYVTSEESFLGTLSQYNIDPITGGLTPKSPATVATGGRPEGVAVTPLPRVPTSKEQCKHGGWRNYPQFKNQGQCVAFVVKQARQNCVAERAKIGLQAFRNKYGLGRYHVLALRRCVNRASR
jgi:6-phosphogluconolactonase